MTYAFDNVKKVVVLGTAVFAVAAIPALLSRDTSFDLGVITSAQAQEDHAASKKGTGAGGKGSGGGVGVGQGKANGGTAQGSKSVESLLKGSSTSAKGKGGPSADSDRPPTAGIKGGKSTSGGGQPAGSGTKKGDLFGDIFVLVRDPLTGAALPDPTGLPQVQAYIKLPDGTLQIQPGVFIPRDAEGNLILTTYTTKEVEFGRLSVGRAPTKVLDHSLVEAVNKLIAADASPTDNTEIVLDAAGRLAIKTTTIDPVTLLPVVTVKAIDSPLENLALYKAIANLDSTARTITVAVPAAKDGTTPATTLTWDIPSFITNDKVDQLKASLLAAAGDKTGTITLDTVMYLNPIIGVTDTLSGVVYSREATYKDLKVVVLIKTGVDPVTGKDVLTATEVSVYDKVFNSTPDGVAPGAADFATSVNDALQVLEYIHDNAYP